MVARILPWLACDAHHHQLAANIGILPKKILQVPEFLPLNKSDLNSSQIPQMLAAKFITEYRFVFSELCAVFEAVIYLSDHPEAWVRTNCLGESKLIVALQSIPEGNVIDCFLCVAHFFAAQNSQMYLIQP